MRTFLKMDNNRNTRTLIFENIRDPIIFHLVRKDSRSMNLHAQFERVLDKTSQLQKFKPKTRQKINRGAIKSDIAIEGLGDLYLVKQFNKKHNHPTI